MVKATSTQLCNIELTYNAVEGNPSANDIVATFSDNDPYAFSKFFAPGNQLFNSGTINWGDGTTSSVTASDLMWLFGNTAGSFAVRASHTYAEMGQYLVSVTISTTDAFPATSSNGAVFNVADAPLTPNGTTLLYNSTEGASTGTVLLGTFTDGNPSATTSDFHGTINWGDGTTTNFVPGDSTVTQPGGVNTAFDVSGSHTYAEKGTYHVRVFVEDGVDILTPHFFDASDCTLNNAIFTVGDAALTASAVPNPLNSVEGASTLTQVVATFTDANPTAPKSDFSGTILWGDGTSSSFTSANVTQPGGVGTPFDVSASHVYTEGTSPPDAATVYAVKVTINDVDGDTTTATNTSVTVTDAALTASVKPVTINAVEGIPTGTKVLATFTDANPYATVSDFTTAGGSVSINWGGTGTGATGPTVTLVSKSPLGVTFSVSGGFTYADEGTYPIKVTITDNGGSTTSATATAVVVADAKLTPGPAVPMISAVEGNSTGSVLLAEFNDANPAAPITDMSGTINWGDGSPLQNFTPANVSQPGGTGTVFQVKDTHTYAEEGIYHVTMTINDLGGSSLTLNNTIVNVGDATLTASALANPLPSTEGISTGSQVLATFSDGNPKAPISDFSGTILWGDGSSTNFASASVTQPGGIGNPFNVSGSHIYADEGSYHVTVKIKDVDGSTATATNTTFTVADAALTAGPAVSISSVEGNTTGNVVVAKFIDGDPTATKSDFSGTINWGDGNTTNFTSANVTEPGGLGTPFYVNGSHVYADEIGSPYTVTVTINDDGGQQVILNTPATVADAPLTAMAKKTITGVEGNSTGNVVIAQFIDGNPGATASDFTASVTNNWGNPAGTVAFAANRDLGFPHGVQFDLYGQRWIYLLRRGHLHDQHVHCGCGRQHPVDDRDRKGGRRAFDG